MREDQMEVMEKLFKDGYIILYPINIKKLPDGRSKYTLRGAFCNPHGFCRFEDMKMVLSGILTVGEDEEEKENDLS